MGSELGRLVGRGAVRSFTTEPIGWDAVRSIVDCARRTGSARNRQPWRVVAVVDHGLRSQLAALGAYAAHLADAPLVLVVLSPAERALDTEFDTGRFVQSLTLAASESGLGSCVVSLYPEENSRRAADLVSPGSASAEPGWTARHAVAVGHPAPVERMGRSAIPTGRLPLDEVLRIL